MFNVHSLPWESFMKFMVIVLDSLVGDKMEQI